MRILLVSVGRPRQLAPEIADYESRAARYWPLLVREVREERGGSLTPAQVREREGGRLLEAAGQANVVACDERGEQLESHAFAAWLREERERGGPDLAFLLGGANGLGDEVRDRARRTIAFSRWTLPHELARLVLAEQLYRAGTIIRGEPYHK